MHNLYKNTLFLSLLIITNTLYGLDYGLPRATNNIIVKDFYTLQYNEKYEQPDWVYYNLTKEEVYGESKRKDSFKADLEVITGSAQLSDYTDSGYDRGHLAPAADMKMSEKSMSDSFYLSNMSPQEPGFNRGIWSKLESYVRTWAVEYGSIYIVSGPVFTTNPVKTIGKNRVGVPDLFYKVILNFDDKNQKAIGFLIPNKKSSTPISEYAISVNDIEDLTGVDFFFNLPDDIEEELESNVDRSLWLFKSFRR